MYLAEEVRKPEREVKDACPAEDVCPAERQSEWEHDQEGEEGEGHQEEARAAKPEGDTYARPPCSHMCGARHDALVVLQDEEGVHRTGEEEEPAKETKWLS